MDIREMKTEPCEEPLLSWTIIDGVRIPSFQRTGCEFVPVRLVESTLLSRFPNSQELRDSPLDGYLMTATEAATLNIATSPEVPYSTNDVVMKMTDFLSFYQKVKEHFSVPVDCGPDSMTGGWLQLNNIVLPYVMRQTSKIIPLDIVRVGGRILTDVDMREYELIPAESERVFLNRSLKLCGFEYRLTENVSKLVDLTVVWLFCRLDSTKLVVRELPGKDPIGEADYEDFDAAEDDEDDASGGNPSPILSDDSGIDVSLERTDVKPILITPIVRSDSITCLFDDNNECSEEALSCQESSPVELVSHDVSSAVSANESSAARQHLQSILVSRCDSEQSPASGVPKRKRDSPLGRKTDKSKLRKVSERLPDTNTTIQQETPTMTSPARDVENSRIVSFENNDNVAGRQPAYPSAPNGSYAVNWSNENGFSTYRYAPWEPYRHPLERLDRVQSSLTSGQYQPQPELDRQHVFGPRPPLAAISGTSLEGRTLGANNPSTYYPYDTASRAQNSLNSSSAYAGFCVDGSGMASQRSALSQQQNTARINGPARRYYREMMTGRNNHCQNMQIPSAQHTGGTAHYENNYIMQRLDAQNNVNNAPAVNSNRVVRSTTHNVNRMMPSAAGYGRSINAKETPLYPGTATGCPLPGNSYVAPVANEVRRAIPPNRPAVPGMMIPAARNADQLQSMSGAYQNPAQQIPPAVHTVSGPYARSGNAEFQFNVPARRNTVFGGRTMVPSVQQRQDQSARMQYLNSQSVSNASRMLEMHKSAARAGLLHRSQATNYGYGLPPQSNITAPPAVPASQAEPRAFHYGSTKPWSILYRLPNADLIITARVVGKEVACLARHDGLYAPLKSLHEALFAEYFSLDDWLYMMYVTFGAATMELSDDEERAFELCNNKSGKMQCKRAISLPEFYKQLEHFGMR